MEQVRLFFSHSSKDDDFGRRLVADLRAHLGEDAIWYDVSGGLHGGDEWWNRIVAEITARDTFLVLLSPDALASDWVPREMGIAYWQHVKLGKRLMPLMHRSCEAPADWQLIQALPFTDDLPYEVGLTSLLHELGYTGAITAQSAQSASVAEIVPATAETPRNRLAARLTQEIHTAFGRENWRQVLLRARTLQEEAPEVMTPQLWREQGLAAVELKDGATALASLDQALATEPYDVPTLLGKARALVMLNQPQKAVKLLERAQSYVPMGDTETQAMLLTEIIEVLDEQDKEEEVLATYDQLLAVDPVNAVTWWFNKGEYLSAVGQHEEAIEAFDEALTLNTRDKYSWAKKGDAFSALEEYEEAIGAYTQALALDPEWEIMWVKIGDAYCTMERNNEAVIAYDHALALEPTDSCTWSAKCDLLFEMGRYEEALAGYNHLLTLDPNDEEALSSIANALAALGRHQESDEAARRAKALRETLKP